MGTRSKKGDKNDNGGRVKKQVELFIFQTKHAQIEFGERRLREPRRKEGLGTGEERRT